MLHPNMSSRSIMLDSIRAVAISMVLVFHVAVEYDASSIDFVATWFLKYGFLGVDIFFPLSGFLITRFLINNHGNSSIKTFFLRRFFRIFPLYIIAVTAYFIAAKITNHELDTLNRIWINYLFLTGWFIFVDGRESVPYTITWSLSVEEFAYIIFGFASWFLRARFVVILALLSVLPLIFRFYLIYQGYDNIYFFPLTRLDSIAIGGLVAVLIRNEIKLLALLTFSLIFACVLSGLSYNIASPLLYTKISLITCLLIVIFETRLFENKLKENSLLPFKILSVVGFYSYYIYLFHYFNIYFFLAITEKIHIANVPFWISVVVCFFATFVQAYFSFRYFEGPMMRFGKSLETWRPKN